MSAMYYLADYGSAFIYMCVGILCIYLGIFAIIDVRTYFLGRYGERQGKLVLLACRCHSKFPEHRPSRQSALLLVLLVLIFPVAIINLHSSNSETHFPKIDLRRANVTSRPFSHPVSVPPQAPVPLPQYPSPSTQYPIPSTQYPGARAAAS